MSATEPTFVPKPGQTDYTNIRWVPVIDCVLFYKNKFLIVKRSKNLRLYPGYWNGISGFLDDAQNLEDKVAEEISEELGLTRDKITQIKLAGIFDVDDPEYKKTWITHAICVELNTDQIKLYWEAESHAWIDPKDLSNYAIIPTFKRVVDLALAK